MGLPRLVLILEVYMDYEKLLKRIEIAIIKIYTTYKPIIRCFHYLGIGSVNVIYSVQNKV